MIKRVFFGIIMALLVIVFLFLDTVPRVLMLAAVMMTANFEMLRAIRAFGLKPRSWPTYVFILLLIPSALINRIDMFWSALVVVTIALFIQRVFFGNISVLDIFSSLLPIIYPLGFFQFLLMAAVMERSSGTSVLLLGIGGACLTDSFALFGGLLFGKKKLAPDISPKKTWEGAISGFVFGGFITAVLLWMFEGLWRGGYPFLLYLTVSLLVSAAAQIGDLAASSIKREAGIKDFGKLIPGHGGVMDRLDSILFAMPMAMLLELLYPFFNRILA